MAKDPAILFYSSDFLVGTALMNEAEVGQYMRIMCHVHQSGHLSMEDMKNICPNISSKVVAKFKQDPAGLYYNERLESEIQKRKKYSESRRNNRLKGKDQSHVQSYDTKSVNHMSTHMENVNENRNVNEIVIEDKGVQGESIDVRLQTAFDEQTIDTLHMTFRDKSVFDELQAFIAKVRGAPENYRTHDANGLRLAFNYQLRNSKKNATKFNSKADQRTGNLIADFAERAGAVAAK